MPWHDPGAGRRPGREARMYDYGEACPISRATSILCERWTLQIVREMTLGATLGLLYGCLIALSAPFVGSRVDDPLALGFVLTLGMMGSMTIAATVGTGSVSTSM